MPESRPADARFPSGTADVTTADAAGAVRYSICTLVTRPAEYAEMVQSFRDGGFAEGCEYLYVDNSRGNGLDGYGAYRLFLQQSKGQFVIICHQDILLLADGRAQLDAALAGLEAIDPNWAICGNAGGGVLGDLPTRISDPYGDDRTIGNLPQRVGSVDENFVVIKASSGVAPSRNLQGFHLYATDLCIVADILGWSSYVIDFHLRHKSGGTPDHTFHNGRSAIMAKYSKAFRGGWVATPSTVIYIGSNRLLGQLTRSQLTVKLLHKLGVLFPRLGTVFSRLRQ